MRSFEPQAGFTHMAPTEAASTNGPTLEILSFLAVIDAKNCKLRKFARMGTRFKRHWTIVTYKPQCQCYAIKNNKPPYPSMSVW